MILAYLNQKSKKKMILMKNDYELGGYLNLTLSLGIALLIFALNTS